MKKYLYSFFILFALAIGSIKAQSYYQRSYTQFIERTEQVLLPNEDLIIAGIHYTNGQAGIPVIRLNQCGSAIWSILLSDSTKDVELIDMKMDNAQNLFLAGHYFMRNGERNIFLAKIAFSGQVQFFKVFDSGTADILYSMDISVNKEIFLYFKTNIGQAGPLSINTVASFDNSGSLNWLKEYGFTAVWGQLTASSDGGFFITESRMVQKFNRAGNSEWAKQFNRSMYAQDNIQAGNNLIMFRYPQASSGFSTATSINLNGDIDWHSRLIPNYRPYRGIARANGNILYLGKLSLGPTVYHPLLVELDPQNGDILKSVLHQEFMPEITPYDLDELRDSSIIYNGFVTRNTFGTTQISRVDKALSRIGCRDSIIIFNTQRDSSVFLNYPPWSNASGSIPILNLSLESDPFTFGNNQLLCEHRLAQNLDLGNDTTLCPGNLWQFEVPDTFDGFSWNGPSSGRMVRASQAGTYLLNAWQKCDTISDTININYYILSSLNLGPDTSICSGDTVELSTDKGDLAIWSTGDTASQIKVFNPGQYYASISTACGLVSDTIDIKAIPNLKLNLGNDTLICKGESIELKLDENAQQILWSTGSTEPQIELNSQGQYWVEISNQCESLSDTIELGFHPTTIAEFQVEEIKAEVYDSVRFTLLKPRTYLELMWHFGDGNTAGSRIANHTYTNADVYHAELILIDTSGCKTDSSFLIEILPSKIMIPNVFTPNGDGINDNFALSIKGLDNIIVQIFNRWGKVEYEGRSNIWDGKNQSGRNLEAGQYFYLIQYQQIDQEVKQIQGTVTILD